MTMAEAVTALIFSWLLGVLWGEVWRVITRNWLEWLR
jgi:predicted outer membrane lipoprotein